MVGQSSLPSVFNEQAVFTENRRALVVGVNKVPLSNKNSLNYAVNDARAIASVLEKDCGFTLICEPLLDEKAGSNTILFAISQLMKDSKDDDFLLFYFAGHGIAYKHGETVDKTDIYLGTADFSPAVVNMNRDAHLSLRQLRKSLFDDTRAGKVLIILDCCYAGNFIGYGSDPTFDELRGLISYYFDLNAGMATTMHGLRLCLAATAYDRTAPELEAEEHGLLTRWLLPALSGEANEAIDYAGRVTFYSLRTYLQDMMKDAPPSGSGADAGRECILAMHSKHPISYFPYGHDPLFRPREGEFETLEPLLLSGETTPVRLGLIGMGGVGKSHLARELISRTQKHFTDGVFWVAANEDQTAEIVTPGGNPLVHPLAVLAGKAQYLPPGDDNIHPNEELRARHLCRFLAQRPHALLILDNLDDPHLVTTALPDLAGMSLQCSVLYTSRRRDRPAGVHLHRVEPLRAEQDLLSLLLDGINPDVFTRSKPAQRSNEQAAARAVCQRVGGLPLALTLLRRQLEQNEWLTLVELDRQLRVNGVLALARDEAAIQHSLKATFRLSWQRVNDELARHMFLFAAHFHPATPMSLWLLALACGVAEYDGLNTPLQQARSILRGLSLVEDVSRTHIQVHPLLCDFGQALASEAPDGQALRQAAAERITSAFEEVTSLEQRAREGGFWRCLSQLRTARVYVTTLQPGIEDRLRRVERRLDQETPFLATSGFWPEQLPGLFYQQMYNRLLEEEQPLPPPPPAGTQWLRQMERVGIEDTGLIRVFSGHTGGVNSVAFSPDGTKVLTGSEDRTARIFETASGRTLHVLSGHKDVIDSVAYAPQGDCVLTGSRDKTARLWDVESGKCIRIFEGHTYWVNAVAFSYDGRWVVTGSQDGTARLWERSTGQVHATFSARAHSVHLLNAPEEDNKEDMEIASAADPDSYAIYNVAYSPDHNQVALGSASNEVFLWDITNGTSTRVDIDSFSFIASLAFSPDGRRLLIGANSGEIVLWDCVRAISLHEPFIDTKGILSSMAFSHDPAGACFLSSSWDGLVRVWDTEGGQQLSIFERHTGTINSVALSPDDTMILVGSSDATVRLWEQPGRPGATPVALKEEPGVYRNKSAEEKSPSQPLSLYLSYATFSPDGAHLVATTQSMITTIWDTQNRQRRFALPDQSLTETFDGLGLVSEQTYFFHKDEAAKSRFSAIEVVNSKSGELLHTIPLKKPGEEYYEAAFSRDGRYLLTGSTTSAAYLWNTTTGKLTKILKGHTDIVTQVAFSADGTKLLTGSRDRTARLWTRHSNEYIPIVLPGHGGEVTKIAFSEDGARAFTGSGDALLRVWDATNGDLLDVCDGHTGTLTIIEGSPSGEYVLVGDMFNQVRIWRVAEHNEMVAAFATNSRLLAAHWQDNHTILLVDDAATEGFPRMYTLRLET